MSIDTLSRTSVGMRASWLWLGVVIAAACGPMATASGAGTTWIDISPQMSTSPLRIGLVANDPDLIFLGSWGEGLYRSLDRGATWTQNHDDFYVNDNVASDVVIEAGFDATGQKGVAITFSGSYVSVDGGQSWVRHVANLSGDCPGTGHAIARIPDGSGLVVSELWAAGRSGAAWIYEWATGSWRVLNPSMFIWNNANTLGLAFDVGSPPNLYVCNSVRNFFTDDLGGTLHPNSNGLSAPGSNVIVCDPEEPERVLVAVDNVLYRQDSRGGAWSVHGDPLPSLVLALIHAPGDPDRMFAGTSIGILESRDRGLTWASLDNSGLPFAMVVDLEIHPLVPDELLAAVSAPSPTAGGLYRLHIDSAGAVFGTDDQDALPGRSRLLVTPNPAGSRVDVALVAGGITGSGDLRLEVYDLRGRRVRAVGTMPLTDAGAPPVRWDARDDTGTEVPSGVYILRLRAASGTLATARVTVQR